MFKKLKALLSKDSARKFTYDDAKSVLNEGSAHDRKLLAAHTDTKPEVLYYMATDQSVEVRREVVNNPETPILAHKQLADDEDAEIRAELARKIGRLMPDLGEAEQSTIRDTAIEILERLAQDQLPRVRAILAEEVKSSVKVPKGVVRKLADDVEDIVSAPILEYSPLLNDDDLREIIAAGTSQAALAAIASREDVSESVASDIAGTLEVSAVAALLTNPNAQIREDTLDQIIEQAKQCNALHHPLAMRPQLSIRAMKRIAGFVASALVHIMVERNPIKEEAADALLEKVRERLASERLGEDEEKAIAAHALKLHREGALTDNFFRKEIESGERELVLQAFAVKADLPAPAVRKIIMSKSGRAVTALAWKAELSMKTAFEIQTKFALVPNSQLLAAKSGVKYPLDEDELDWHLSYFLDE